MEIRKAEKERELKEIFWLYDSAFPASEKKPFSVILEKQKQGSVDILYLEEDGQFAGLAITAKKGDLVLLDYEMPVCDGKQTLEMLRSEKAFADITVIFLTGRRDPQSMIQVMPLKPAGYLLKNSKPAELKKEIDAFFAKQKA